MRIAHFGNATIIVEMTVKVVGSSPLPDGGVQSQTFAKTTATEIGGNLTYVADGVAELVAKTGAELTDQARAEFGTRRDSLGRAEKIRTVGLVDG